VEDPVIITVSLGISQSKNFKNRSTSATKVMIKSQMYCLFFLDSQCINEQLSYYFMQNPKLSKLLLWGNQN